MVSDSLVKVKVELFTYALSLTLRKQVGQINGACINLDLQSDTCLEMSVYYIISSRKTTQIFQRNILSDNT